ncbi:MAG: hypothetical protein WC824_15330, partial [Bacteroidota bacterium]
PGDFARAGKWYRAALRDSLSAPGDGGATLSVIHSRLGIMSFGKGANEASLASFMHATTYRSAPAVVWSNLGFALFRNARFAESARAFTTTLRMDSSDVNALYCLGRLTLGNPATALSGRWLLQRFLIRERNTARSADAERMLAAAIIPTQQ